MIEFDSNLSALTCHTHMTNDNSLFFGGGGFGGINKAKVMKTVFVPISKPTQSISPSKEQLYKEPIIRKKTIRKSPSKKKIVAKKIVAKKRHAKNIVNKKKTHSKKNKIDKFQNF